MKKGIVVFFGSTLSGKTSLINLFFNKQYPLRTSTFPDIYKHYIKKFGKVECELVIFDTLGYVRYQVPNNAILKIKGQTIVIICYDLHSANGGEEIQYYIDQVKSCNQNAKIVIVGTKQNLGEHENLKNIDKQFPDYRFYKVGLNSEEILNQIFNSFYEEIIAQQTLIQQELQIDQDRKLIENRKQQSSIKKQKKQIWGLCSYEYDDD